MGGYVQFHRDLRLEFWAQRRVLHKSLKMNAVQLFVFMGRRF